MSLWLAGEVGQVGLARSAGQPGMRASVDQHAAEIRDALGLAGVALYLLGRDRLGAACWTGAGWVGMSGAVI